MQRAQRKSGLRLPARASLWYVLSSAAARGVSMLGTPIFTRLLSPEEYGLYPLFNLWLGLFFAFATLELTGSALYRALQRFEGERAQVLSATFGLCLIPFSVLAAAYALFSGRINTLTGLSTNLTLLLFCQVLINLPIALFSARCRFEYRYRAAAGINLLSALLNPTVSFLIIGNTSIKAEGRILAALLVSLPISVFVSKLILKEGGRLYSKEVWSFLLRFGLPLFPHYLSLSVILRAGELAVERFHGAEAMGKFAVASAVGLGLNVLSTGISSALTPWSLRKLAQGKTREVSELLKLTTSALAIGVALLLCFAPEALRLIAPSEYCDALGAVYPIAASLLPAFISGAVSSAESFYERTSATTLPSLCAAGLCILLSLLLVPVLDYRAAGLCSLLSYVLLASLKFISFRRLCGSYPLPISWCGGAALLFSLYVLLAFLLSGNLVGRIFLSLPLIPVILSVSKDAFIRIREE